jgi:hypothetical protein
LAILGLFPGLSVDFGGRNVLDMAATIKSASGLAAGV